MSTVILKFLVAWKLMVLPYLGKIIAAKQTIGIRIANNDLLSGGWLSDIINPNLLFARLVDL